MLRDKNCSRAVQLLDAPCSRLCLAHAVLPVWLRRSSAAIRDVGRGYASARSAGLAQLVGPWPGWNVPAAGRHRAERGSVLLEGDGQLDQGPAAPSLSCSMLAFCIGAKQHPPALEAVPGWLGA